MPLPIAPIAGIALRYGAVALVSAALASRALPRRSEKSALNQAALDEVENGLHAHRFDGDDEMQIEATHGHWKQIWFGSRGLEIDSRALARLRFRRISK